MDVDICSSPFNAARHFAMKTNKRVRSPDDDSPVERPVKRKLYAIHDASSSVLRQSASTSSSRHPSEDWVKQAGGLTIDSPVLETFVESAEPRDDVESSQDVDMVVEPPLQPESPVLTMHRPHLHPLHTTNIGISHIHNNEMQMHSHYLLPYDNTDSTKLHGPAIKLVPPTPMSTMGQTIESPRLPSISPMSASPLTPCTARKQKFAMGPRVDCEKCRLGVKGHWAHLD